MTSDPARAAYAAGLGMLARRELSEAQLRERLARRQHETAAIEQAVTRLRDAGALDDRRVAVAIARTEAHIRSRGRTRALHRLHAAGIDDKLAEEAVAEVFGALDERALLERALERRLRGPSGRILDAAHFRRLYQQLVRQGFSPSAVMATLKARARHQDQASPDDEEHG